MTKRSRAIGLAAASAAVVAAIAPAGPAAADTGNADPGDPVMRLCVDDGMKGYCVVRWNYDSNFNNDKYWAATRRSADDASGVDEGERVCRVH